MEPGDGWDLGLDWGPQWETDSDVSDSDTSESSSEERFRDWSERLGPERPTGFTSNNCKDSQDMLEALTCPICLDILWVRNYGRF